MDDTAVLGYSELLEDEVTKESAWYSWDADNGILTLRGQLPDTDEYKTLADKAGIIGGVVKKVIIERGTKAGTSLTFAFEWFIALESIEGLNNLDTSNVTDMSFMFCSCSSLTSLDVSNFNTTNVINMRSMFNGCSGLTSLDVSNFNTTNVTNMRCMFNGCSSLTSLDVSKFNTANVTDMNGMFYGCNSLTSLDLSNFNTANVTDMNGMFDGCSSLTSLDVSKFNTANVT
ncbi:MAG: BspA family leucine-rich repeat surface protein, partial [Oscillospiraceae bacterium]|nr:BspA family leucine-rich repeat surface protein [Oscillospiraceae bacterium]